jgi:DNA replication protein DnaC
MIIKHNEFGELVDFVLNAFKEHPKTAKQAINSLVGMFGRRNGTYIESRICERDNLDDIGNAYEKLDKPYCVNLNDDIVAVNSSRRIEKIELHYPIHAQILDCEAIELHKITKRIEQWGGIPLEIKTDCVNYASNHEIELYGYWDTQNTIKKYRCEEYKPLKHEINISNTETLEIEPNIYNNVCEIDDFNELANNIISSNKGCLLLGMAGCGKTYLTNKIIDLLEEGQEKKVVKLAPTNKATLNIKGKTLDKFSYGLIQGKNSIKKFSNIDYVIIDEVSMMKEIFYQVLLYIKKYNPSIKFIIVGDFGQLEPVKDRCKFNYENSRCLYELVDGNKLTLTVCKRSNNKLFNECLRVRDNKPLKYKYVPETETYLNVSYTNSTRKFINEECVNRFISQNENVKTAKIEALPYDKNSQSYLLAKGMPVISRINSKSMGIVNNETFMVIKITNEFITVKNELNEEKEVKKATFNRLFHLAFCITVHKSQGATFNKPYTIYDWEIMNNKLKYVAISRATKIENIQIDRCEENFKNFCDKMSELFGGVSYKTKRKLNLTKKGLKSRP